jgi:ribosome-associated protein
LSIKPLSNIINKSGDIIVYEDNSRSQLDNKETAINRLNSLIHNALKKPKPRKPTRPSKTSVYKRLESKKIDGIKKMNRRRFDE